MNDGSSRKPLPERAYVSLVEALTWIASGDPMTSDRLREQVEGKRPIGADGPDERLRKFFVGTTPETSETHGEAHFEDRSAGIKWLRMAWQGLRERVRQQRAVSEKQSATYAPKVFASMAESKGIGAKRLEAAMDRLFRINAIERGELGWDDGHRHIVIGLCETAGIRAGNTAAASAGVCP